MSTNCRVLTTSGGKSPSGSISKELTEECLFPPVRERLGCIRPSQELLEYYRIKISEYDGEYDKLIKKLDKYQTAYEHVHQSHWEIRQREDEIKELQKALSDMQVFLFQEREHVLRLYAENDRLKIKELEDRKRVQHLLSLTKPSCTGDGESTYFVKQPPGKVLVHRHKSDLHLEQNACSNSRGPGGHKQHGDDVDGLECCNCETMLLTVEALKAQLEEQTRLCKEQVDALLEDRSVRMEESQTSQDRDAAKIQILSDRLLTTQNMLYDSTKDYLDLKYEFRSHERAWMAEKDALLSEMEGYREKLDASEGVDPILGRSCAYSPCQHQEGGSRSRRVPSARQLQLQLLQAQQVTDNYREQCVHMEQELCQLREHADASKDLFGKRSSKMVGRLKLMNERYEALEKRRRLEIEGYKTDIKMLRERLKEVEKQLYKTLYLSLNGKGQQHQAVTLCLTGGQDMKILNYVKSTSQNAKKLMGDLQNLKAKVYSLENDVRHVHDH